MPSKEIATTSFSIPSKYRKRGTILSFPDKANIDNDATLEVDGTKLLQQNYPSTKQLPFASGGETQSEEEHRRPETHIEEERARQQPW